MHPFIHELIEKIYERGNFDGSLNVNSHYVAHVIGIILNGEPRSYKPTVILSKPRINSRGQDYYWLAAS